MIMYSTLGYFGGTEIGWVDSALVKEAKRLKAEEERKLEIASIALRIAQKEAMKRVFSTIKLVEDLDMPSTQSQDMFDPSSPQSQVKKEEP